MNLNLKGFIGHTYGAKLLYDFLKTNSYDIPAIFLAVAESMIIPRLNNIMADLAYLKTIDKDKYQALLDNMDNGDLPKIWDLTEKLAPLFQENKNRPYLYWANLEWYEKVQTAQKAINLPINNKTFMAVRKDLYASQDKIEVNIPALEIPYLWINGFHDFVMNGAASIFTPHSKITPFFKSAHYPHIEENALFCEVVNDFLI